MSDYHEEMLALAAEKAADLGSVYRNDFSIDEHVTPAKQLHLPTVPEAIAAIKLYEQLNPGEEIPWIYLLAKAVAEVADCTYYSVGLTDEITEVLAISQAWLKQSCETADVNKKQYRAMKAQQFVVPVDVVSTRVPIKKITHSVRPLIVIEE